MKSIKEVFRKIESSENSNLHEQADSKEVAALLAKEGVQLPAAHLEALSISNGFDLHAGFVKVYGVGSNHAIDSIRWNQTETWKFSWGKRVEDFWFFGGRSGTAQLAYSRAELKVGRQNVYYVDSYVAEIWYDSFDAFLEQVAFIYKAGWISEFLQGRYGTLGPRSQYQCVPRVFLLPMWLQASDHEYFVIADAESSMIEQGDVTKQFAEHPMDTECSGYDYIFDEKNRRRIKLRIAGEESTSTDWPDADE